MKKVIGFDLGYTLVHLLREIPYQSALRKLGFERSLEQIERAQHMADKIFMRDFQGVFGREADTYYPWYVGTVNYHLGVSVNLIAFCQLLSGEGDKKRQWEVYPWTHQVLDELKKSNYRLFLLSNWDSSAREVLKALELDSYFDEIIISSEVGMEKPDSRIFQLALDRMGARPSEVVYVGDNNYDDCVGASKLGIDSLLINRFGKYGIEEIHHRTIIKDIRELLNYVSGEQMEVG